MKRLVITAFCISVCGVGLSWGRGYLTAQSFPKTFEDLPFSERMDALAEGYEPFESQFDSNGRCISNCVYQGLTIDEVVALTDKNTQEALDQAQGPADANASPTEPTVNTNGGEIADGTPTNNVATPDGFNNTITPNGAPNNNTFVNNSPTNNGAIGTGGVPSSVPVNYTTVSTGAGARHCAAFNSDIPVGQKEPWGWPLSSSDGELKIGSKWGARTIGGKKDFHYGVDMRARYRPVYAPADGVVDHYTKGWACGIGMVIKHSNGFSTTYCHLQSRDVSPGDTVYAGCKIATSGATGGAKANKNYKISPHLHYGISRNGQAINPEPFVMRRRG